MCHLLLQQETKPIILIAYAINPNFAVNMLFFDFLLFIQDVR